MNMRRSEECAAPACREIVRGLVATQLRTLPREVRAAVAREALRLANGEEPRGPSAFVPLAEAAQMLGVTASTLHKAVAKRAPWLRGAVKRRHRHLFIRRADIEERIASGAANVARKAEASRLIHDDGLSIGEIARRTGAAYTFVQRARTRLREGRQP